MSNARENRRILVLEEDELLRQWLERLLLNAGYEMLHAHSREQAVERAAMDRPRAVLLSLSLPENWGLDFYADLKSSPLMAGTPVIAMASAQERETCLQAFKKFLAEKKQLSAPDETIVKPVDGLVLLEILKRFVP